MVADEYVRRVPLARDRRLFLPFHRHSRRFRRTSVERLFARLDHLYGFERHTVRGLRAMQLRMAMARSAMLATALGWLEMGRRENLRRRLQAA